MKGSVETAKTCREPISAFSRFPFSGFNDRLAFALKESAGHNVFMKTMHQRRVGDRIPLLVSRRESATRGRD